jgi:hypothetical protein
MVNRMREGGSTGFDIVQCDIVGRLEFEKEMPAGESAALRATGCADGGQVLQWIVRVGDFVSRFDEE